MSDELTVQQEAHDREETAERRDRRSKRGRRILAFILVILFLLLIAVTAFLVRVVSPKGGVATKAQSNGIEWVRSIYGWGAGAAQQLSTPVAVGIGPNGTIWVPVAKTQSVIGFNPDGSYKAQLKNPEIKTVNALAVDAQGNVYTASNGRDVVNVISPSDQLLFTIHVQNPIAVAVGTDRIAIGSSPGFAITDKQGKKIKILGTRGSGPDQFDSVSGLAIGSDGHIYAVDTYNNRISAYDRDGNRIWMVNTGHPGNDTKMQGGGSQVTTTSAEAKLQLPLNVTIDGRGRLVVIDPYSFSLTVFDPGNGKMIAKYGEYGTQDGQFYYPSSLSYDPARDWFAVADTANDRVQIIRIPDSSASAALPSINRMLSGPVRACCAPLILLLIALLLVLFNRRRKRKKPKKAAAKTALEATPEPATPVEE